MIGNRHRGWVALGCALHLWAGCAGSTAGSVGPSADGGLDDGSIADATLDDSVSDGGGIADAGPDAGIDDGDAGAMEDEVDLCTLLRCEGGSCDPATGGCFCAAGDYFDGLDCAQTRPCLGDGSCDDVCPIPRAPIFDIIQADEVLAFTTVDGATLEVGVASDPVALQPDMWIDGSVVDLSEYAGQHVRVFARIAEAACSPSGFFNAVYDVRQSYPGAAGEPGSTAIARDDPAIGGWASEVIDVTFGPNVDAQWRDTSRALGPAEGTATDVVALGDGGFITLGFDALITDGPGPDLAVFENSFSDGFLEFASVEVSSDGQTFVSFDGASLRQSPVDSHETVEPRLVHGWAGLYRAGQGSPFDLALLRQHTAVVSGQLDLNAISHVRIVDVVGDGNTEDAFGRPVYDPYPGTETAGFDLDAVGVLGVAP